MTIISKEEIGQRTLKARMHFENMVCQQANHEIEKAADRGQYSTQLTIMSIPHPEFHGKIVVGMLTKAGYTASYVPIKDGVRVTVCWVPNIEDFPLLNALEKVKK